MFEDNSRLWAYNTLGALLAAILAGLGVRPGRNRGNRVLASPSWIVL